MDNWWQKTFSVGFKIVDSLCKNFSKKRYDRSREPSLEYPGIFRVSYTPYFHVACVPVDPVYIINVRVRTPPRATTSGMISLGREPAKLTQLGPKRASQRDACLAHHPRLHACSVQVSKSCFVIRYWLLEAQYLFLIKILHAEIGGSG